MTSPIIDFIEARIAEDEATARAALDPKRPGTHWQWVNDETDEPIGDLDEDSAISGLSLRTVEEFASDLPAAWVGDGLLPAFVIHTAEEVIPGAGDHIARHDPARVLREVAAKRAILADIVSAMNGMDLQINSEWGVGPMDPADYESVALLRLLALPYSDHPDYDQSWSTT